MNEHDCMTAYNVMKACEWDIHRKYNTGSAFERGMGVCEEEATRRRLVVAG